MVVCGSPLVVQLARPHLPVLPLGSPREQRVVAVVRGPAGAVPRGPDFPYLYHLIANVLQRMIRQDRALLHTLVDSAPDVVLQYTDDTLIIMRVVPPVAARLWVLLDLFVMATGLVINFHKGTHILNFFTVLILKA
ncbi:hypothetical protein D1007_47823 [Hordeum vulgare]|nr:hypothetical protein D1007_47823 [Hordeum vulgare]